MSTYLKIGISTGLPFGVIAASVYYFGARGEISNAVALGGIAGIFFGVVMAGVFGAIGYLSGEKITYGKTNWLQVMELGIEWEIAQHLSRQSLETLRKSFKIDPRTSSSTEIVAITGMTWRSFGEIISLKISRLPNSLIQLEISSKPKYPATRVDWGVNRRNIEAIAGFMESSIESGKIVASGRIDTLRP